MNEEEIKKQIATLEKCASLDWDEVDPDSSEEIMEELYITLHYMRREISEIIVNLPLPLLTRLARALYILLDIQDNLSVDIQEELEMYFLYENIEEKVEEYRDLSWANLLKYK
ncbi:MAG: hypothetical protein EAX90_12030 [Candidatus Heimdallarchaeota archaeon]|nr:hypothetical protein [Candidatus Heimdallarchaeota archaeon]